MATLKHIASKNSDYTAIEAYLIYQHDEFTGKQLLDEQGKPKLRESYLLDTLECGDFSFATACLLANRKYGKNTQHGDIKSHQYIISFDPRDAADNGLTMEKAQALGLKFCEENFPGHPAIVCTHPDGHNHSGNIHVHIVIGSIRMREVERKPYMQKPRDWCEGMKHSSTAQTMRHLRVEVMELCEGAGLYQIDLLNGSKVRVSEREYWMKQRGQLKLDHENAALLATGQQPTQTKFETAKEVLRRQISEVLNVATSFEDFSDRLLQQYGITVKESRGRLSYLPAGRTKFIRARSIGDKFEKELVLAALKANTERKRTIQSKSDRIGKLIDIQAKLKQGKGIGYERWAKKHNLKTMAQILILLQDKGLLNEDALDQRIAELDTKFHESLAVVKDLETRMAENKTLRSHAAAYKQYRPLAQKRNAAKSPAAFEEQHRVELTAYRAAAAYLKANNITSLPSPNKLESEYCALASEKAQFYEQYKEAKSELLKLKDAKQNVALFFREEKQTQHHEREGVCV
ncbi:relaxase/mobilization nuclease domain-containing protein [Faecalibacterium sp. CLA-AA-H233]|uniref:Relaxase/mobilization nuclease domain-containing protein n=2 Tax=Faecalibacterium butyricigenerans TaxID=1851427 RepID=A0ABS8FB53_9FIRM|nr:relaxase/mobilization nuclease domain-containing protein [Faecalibacterium sp. CLA-AA-H233]MCC2200465.1 relaxase/mobilization nuclease domain-containing protein [Faecalibacterium sp. CLA-AA-H233]